MAVWWTIAAHERTFLHMPSRKVAAPHTSAHGLTYLTVGEAAVRLRANYYTVTRLCATGKLRASKPAGRWLITEAALDDLLADYSNASSESTPTETTTRRRRRRAS